MALKKPIHLVSSLDRTIGGLVLQLTTLETHTWMPVQLTERKTSSWIAMACHLTITILYWPVNYSNKKSFETISFQILFWVNHGVLVMVIM